MCSVSVAGLFSMRDSNMLILIFSMLSHRMQYLLNNFQELQPMILNRFHDFFDHFQVYV